MSHSDGRLSLQRPRALSSSSQQFSNSFSPHLSHKEAQLVGKSSSHASNYLPPSHVSQQQHHDTRPTIHTPVPLHRPSTIQSSHKVISEPLPNQEVEVIHDQPQSHAAAPGGEPSSGVHRELLSVAAECLHAQDYGQMRKVLSVIPIDSGTDDIAVTFGLGQSHFKLREYGPAETYFTRMDSCARELGASSKGDVSIANYYLGEIFFVRCKYTEAAHHYQTSINYHSTHVSVAKVFRVIPPSKSGLWAKLAATLRNNGKIVDAVGAYRESITTATAKKDRLAAHTSLGNLLQNVGDNAKAVEEYEASIQLSEELADKVSLGWAHGNIGNAYLGMNCKEKAVHHLNVALELTLKHEPTPSAIGRAYNNLGTAYQALNELEQAQEYYDLALAQAIYGGDQAGQARVYGNIGNLQMLLKKYDGSIAHYTETLNTTKDKATKLTAHHNRGCASYEKAESDKRKFYTTSFPTFTGTHTESSTATNEEKSKKLFSLTYHGGVLGAIEEDHEIPALPATIQRRYRKAQEDLSYVVSQHYDLALAQAICQSLNELKKAEEHYDLALAQAIYGNDIPGQARAYGNIGNLQMLNKQFDRAVPHYTEVMRLSQDKSTITTAHHNRGCAYYDWAEKEKKDRTQRTASNKPDEAACTCTCTVKVSLHGPNFKRCEEPPFVSNGIQKYYLQGTRDLEYIMRHPEENFNGIKGSPKGLSFSVFLLKTNQQMLCVVGNPTIPPFKYNNDEWNLGKLPHATKEAEWVSHILKYKPILHEQATKDAVMMRIMNAKVIHLATHGSAVAGFLAFARMTASTTDTVDAKRVLIYPEEIESLNISPALVVLSSCDSGRGVFKADGIQGMARAFILAGAQAVLTTLWRVPDESACIFMQFYQYLVAGVKGPEVLHKSILSLRCFKKYSQYIHWSGYQLTGRELQFQVNQSSMGGEKYMSQQNPYIVDERKHHKRQDPVCHTNSVGVSQSPCLSSSENSNYSTETSFPSGSTKEVKPSQRRKKGIQSGRKRFIRKHQRKQTEKRIAETRVSSSDMTDGDISTAECHSDCNNNTSEELTIPQQCQGDEQQLSNEQSACYFLGESLHNNSHELVMTPNLPSVPMFHILDYFDQMKSTKVQTLGGTQLS